MANQSGSAGSGRNDTHRQTRVRHKSRQSDYRVWSASHCFGVEERLQYVQRSGLTRIDSYL